MRVGERRVLRKKFVPKSVIHRREMHNEGSQRHNGADDYPHQFITRPVIGLPANRHVFKD